MKQMLRKSHRTDMVDSFYVLRCSCGPCGCICLTCNCSSSTNTAETSDDSRAALYRSRASNYYTTMG